MKDRALAMGLVAYARKLGVSRRVGAFQADEVHTPQVTVTSTFDLLSMALTCGLLSTTLAYFR